MKTNRPYSNKQLVKWTAFRVERTDDRQKPYELIPTPLIELVKINGYTKFKDKLNWLYNNYSEQNYDLVWKELQDCNAKRIQKCIQDNVLEKAEWVLNLRIEEAKAHFGDIPEWITALSDNQRQLLLDRAKTCYGLEPEYDLARLSAKTIYTVPERFIKDYNEFNEPLYYSQEELYKSKIDRLVYQDLVGKVTVVSEQLRRLAEDAVIRDAKWMSQFNDTEFDMRECREEEGDVVRNKMVPISDLQGPDSPYGLDVVFRDFLEPLVSDDDYN